METAIDWLGSSALSHAVQSTAWAIPALQSVHILFIGAVMAASWVVSLRLFGLVPAVQPLADLVSSSVRWIWCGIAVLLASGSLLVVAEARDILPNWMFQLKMAAVACAGGLLLLYPRCLRSSTSGREQAILKMLAATSLCLFLAIVVAGRWIAYANV